MPVQPRDSDTFSRDNLLLGFSQISFTPTGGAAIPIGILSSQAFQKTVEILQLERGDAGAITIDREIVSRLEMAMALETFNLRSDVAQLLFGSDVASAVTADAAAAVTNEPFNIPAANQFDSFVDLDRGSIDESSLEVTCATVTAEAVGTGDGAANNFVLDYKVKAVGDVTSVTVGGVAYTPIAVGAAAAGNEVEVVVGEIDGAHPTTSGSLEFHVGGAATPPGSGLAIVATYTPSFSTTGTDIVNLTDFVFDPTLGKIRMLDPTGADNSPFRTTGEEQPLEIDYTYNRKAHVLLQPGRQNTFDGTAVVNHLTDIGVNFVWTIPSATVRITDDDLTFGADDFATGALQLTINDAGGSNRFGTIEWSSEPEAGA
jgi:hypothetical protein